MESNLFEGAAPRAVKFARVGAWRSHGRLPRHRGGEPGVAQPAGRQPRRGAAETAAGAPRAGGERLLETQDGAEQQLREILTMEKEVAQNLLNAKEQVHQGGVELQKETGFRRPGGGRPSEGQPPISFLLGSALLENTIGPRSGSAP
uniref:Uncharacterized protein n=1 Tax=Macaca fascicularis TaxID=9541 RepID=A0A7N9D8W0_MACFA